MQFVIVLEGDPPVDLVSRLAQALARVDKDARVHGLAEPLVLEMHKGDALVRVQMPDDDQPRPVLIEAIGQ